MYGITETTVHVTYRPLSAADVGLASVIGIPIPDLQLHVLDPFGSPVPIGVVGEIYVGGAGVARGYRNREELTRQRFLPDLFTNKPDALLYRSGDLARYLPNGDIEYRGRIDNQVKLRGFRIELGEIEAELSSHPMVDQCVVIAHDEGGEKSLVGYVSLKSNVDPDVKSLREHLHGKLPDYMIPSKFVFLERLPLTPNGKIDHKALIVGGHRVIEVRRDTAPPRDSVEQALSQLWAKILNVKRVGLHDNFFELGGHSILAVRMIIEIEKLYGRRLPLATLLQAPTVGSLAEVLRKENWTPSWSSLVPIRPGGSRPPLFLMHSHGGNVLEYHPLVHQLSDEQPVYALQARGLDGNIPRGQTLEQMAAAYLKEIRSLQPQGPYYLGGFCFGGLVALEAAQQLLEIGEEVALVAMIQTTHPSAQRFKPNVGAVQQWWQRTAKRLDLERENLSHRPNGYLRERLRRVWDVTQARTEIAFDRLKGNGGSVSSKSSTPYILETLGIEHDRAFEQYQPKPYKGRVVLMRATKQFSGLASDPRLGWTNELLPILDLCHVPGHQQNLLIGSNVVELAQKLTTYLERSQQEGDSTAPASEEQLVLQ